MTSHAVLGESSDERHVVIDCEGDRLIGVLSQPKRRACDAGVVIVVGGPQYRVGSHRQFVHLARTLAAAGIAVLRFDYRGMGDSEGDARTFETIERDVTAAVQTMLHEAAVARVVLWGLCDGASAALMFGAATAGVVGIVAVNPWARHAQGEASTLLRHYYVERLLSRSFWKKLATGRLSVSRSAREAVGAVRTAARAPAADIAFLSRMERGWGQFRGPVLVLLSGRDLTAREFESWIAHDRRRAALLGERRCDVQALDDADHTFSSAAWRDAVAKRTISWLMHNEQQGFESVV